MADRTYYVYCTSEHEKQEWITILKWKFSCIERSRRQAHRPLETVIFASLSSFLNPKNQVGAFKGTENPIGEKFEAEEAEKLRARPKSVFRLSFRLSRRNKTRTGLTTP